MYRFRPIVCVALTALAAVLFARPVAASEEVPFNGSFDGVVSHSSVDPVTDAVLVEAAGNANHLGQFAVIAPHLVNTPTRTAAGRYEFTAANGDKVYADFTGVAHPTATSGVIAIVETATITGGTGRFAGASGSFVVQRLYDRIAGTTTGSFEGTITSPGANKRK
ncbi:MAG: hypothetical protein JWN40_4537 [Phycisphaerales bacterium]|nr:hypothetical protein [Phycisphaerales bacterium]